MLVRFAELFLELYKTLRSSQQEMGGSLSRGAADTPAKNGHLVSRMRDLPFFAAVPGVTADCDGLLVESSCCTGGFHRSIGSSAFSGT